MKAFFATAAVVGLTSGALFANSAYSGGELAPCSASTSEEGRVPDSGSKRDAPAIEATTVSESTRQADKVEHPACAGNIVRAKLIVLKPAVRDEVAGVVEALCGIKGVIRLSSDDDSGLVSLIVPGDNPMTPERAIEYLALAGYKAAEATDEEADQAARGMHTAPIEVPASVITESISDASTKPIEVGVLKDSLQPLIEAFNREKDKPRLLALLSPT